MLGITAHENQKKEQFNHAKSNHNHCQSDHNDNQFDQNESNKTDRTDMKVNIRGDKCKISRTNENKHKSSMDKFLDLELGESYDNRGRTPNPGTHRPRGTPMYRKSSLGHNRRYLVGSD